MAPSRERIDPDASRRWLERHGPTIRAAVAEEMPDEPPQEVEAITEAVVVRVLHGVDNRPALDDPGTPRWLGELAKSVCADVRQLDVRPWAPPDPDALRRAALERKYEEFRRLNADYPTGVPWLDRYVEWMREWYGNAVGAVVVFGRRLRHALNDSARSAQDRVALQVGALSEVQALLPATAPAMRGAAAAVGLVVGIAFPTLPAASLDAGNVAVPSAVYAGSEGHAAPAPAPVPSPAAVPDSRRPEQADVTTEITHLEIGAAVEEPAPGDTGSDGLGDIRPVESGSTPLPQDPPQPRGSVRSPDEPVTYRDEGDGGGSYVVEGDGGLTVDVDGDGDPEADVPSPDAVVRCPEPEDRGTVTAAACPMVEGLEPPE